MDLRVQRELHGTGSIVQHLCISAAALLWPHSPPAGSGKICLEGHLSLCEKGKERASHPHCPCWGRCTHCRWDQHRAVFLVSKPYTLGEVSVHLGISRKCWMCSSCSMPLGWDTGISIPSPSTWRSQDWRPVTVLHILLGNVLWRVYAQPGERQLPTPELLGSGKLCPPACMPRR